MTPESMPKSILPPKSNTVFQLLFGDPRNIDLLADFLKAVLDIPHSEYRNIVIVNPYLPREYPDKKLGIVDLRLTTRSGQIIHVEIQCEPFSAMRNRLIFYDSSLIVGQLDESRKYHTMKRVISILITGYTLIPESSFYHHRFTLYDHRASVEFTDLLEIRTLELTKIPKIPEPADVYLCHWLRFFNAVKKEEFDMVATASPAIRKATARVMKLSKDERARLMHEYEVRARGDENARLYDATEKGRTEGRAEGLAKGLAKGRAEGLAKGKTEGQIAIIRNMLELKLPIETIVKATGWSPDEIKNIAIH